MAPVDEAEAPVWIVWKSSKTSRLFPIPGTPTSVTSCGERSRATRANVSRSRVSSRSRPTSSAPLDTLHADAGARSKRLPHSDGARLALGIDGLLATKLDRAFRRVERRFIDEDAARRRGDLHARRGVHDISGNHSLARVGPCVERDERLARCDADSYLELPVLGQQVTDRQRRPNGPLRIVLMRDRRAEHGHDRIPDELLDRAAEALQLRAHATVIRPQERADVFRIHPLGTRGEADEVAEEAGDELALLARLQARE